MAELVIPEKFAVLPFYEDTRIECQHEWRDDDYFQYPFLAEILWHNRKLAVPPWDLPLRYVPQVHAAWDEEAEIIESFFSKRDRKAARPYMIKHTANLLSAISWMNRQEVPAASPPLLKTKMDGIGKVPMNLGERVTFIVQSPDHYLSFNQLKGLFIESKKQFAMVKITERQNNTE
ncbi:hypothetical protein D7Z54_08785 [Salibacterium salarium]|uniref:YpoC-like domain-containing protein n=1 Tax=Salibacterium salarium TaxID=284579 RepID=A0A3R9QUJ6_9BACI|nr:hypothetical protein [Salibacterium salarium]RSL33777.1 hypothetical protein D7Z54_08785 [Salibacterium salarium]